MSILGVRGVNCPTVTKEVGLWGNYCIIKLIFSLDEIDEVNFSGLGSFG